MGAINPNIKTTVQSRDDVYSDIQRDQERLTPERLYEGGQDWARSRMGPGKTYATASGFNQITFGVLSLVSLLEGFSGEDNEPHTRPFHGAYFLAGGRHIKPGISRLQPTGHIQPTTCSCE